MFGRARTNDVDFERNRRDMVVRQLVRRGITDPRVLEAMGTIPREEFVPVDLRHYAYGDEPLSIGSGQTISQPYITALMAQSLQLTGTEKVLEIGAGSGYHAAVLARLSREVISLEVVPELVDLARANLARCGVTNVRVVLGDGSLGYEGEQPYDAISVAAASPAVPEPLLAQLSDPGRIVIPVGGLQEQELQLLELRAGSLVPRSIAACRFVPLVGAAGWQDYRD
jgi:protein-L-isoaspartate(D-aspartate) O-methyltransferase